jgi:alpha-glucosidase
VFEFELLQQPWEAGALAGVIDRREELFGLTAGRRSSCRTTTSRGGQPLRQGAGRDAVAKAAAVLLLTLRGTPFLYYGEEIGLGDIKVSRKEIVDPPARRYWPLRLWWNRDQCRAPMPWSDEPNGGFTTGRPWLRLAADYPTRNVAAQAADSRSVLSAYRELLALRRTLPALQAGSFRWVIRARDEVLAYRRDAPGESVLVAINLGAEAMSVPFGDPATAALTWEPVYSTDPAAAGRRPLEGSPSDSARAGGHPPETVAQPPTDPGATPST